MSRVLVLYYSRYGATESLAREIATGVDSHAGAAARLRTVPAVSAVTEATENSVPDDGPPYATRDDLRECAGIIIGSPTRFGNMSAALFAASLALAKSGVGPYRIDAAARAGA